LLLDKAALLEVGGFGDVIVELDVVDVGGIFEYASEK
jgi:hypothetical protein